MSQTKDLSGIQPAHVERPVGEVKSVKDQAKVREILGDEFFNRFFERGANAFKGSGTGVYVFLSFTDDGYGQVRIYDRESVDLSDDSAPEALCIRVKLVKELGEGVNDALYGKALKIMGWPH